MSLKKKKKNNNKINLSINIIYTFENVSMNRIKYKAQKNYFCGNTS